jgi:Peptidase A4 family
MRSRLHHNGSLFVAWKGDGNDNLNVARVSLTGFTVPPYVFQTNIPNFPVNPGDTIFGSVQYINNRTAAQISLANDTSGEHFSVVLTPPPGASFDGNSARFKNRPGTPISTRPWITRFYRESERYLQFLDCSSRSREAARRSSERWRFNCG